MARTSWGEALRLRAAQCGYRTQKELAAATDVSMTTVQTWWRAQAMPPMRFGNDQKLMEVLKLDSFTQLRSLPAMYDPEGEGDDAKARQLLTLLREVDPSVLPLSAVTAALIEWGVSTETISRIMDEIGQAKHRNEGRKVS